MENVAFIGLGTMCIAMARNVIEGGHRVSGYDTNPKSAADLTAIGGAETLAPGALVIDMSTINPSQTDAIRAALSNKGIRMIDAPVGRTSRHAITGEILIMAGGESKDIEQARSVLGRMGDTIIDVSKELNVPLALAADAEAIYAEAHDKNRGTEDWTALYAMLREKYL